jgi:predicted HTH domain antitoxin
MKLELKMPEAAFSSLRKSPLEFAQELKIAACVKWYELGHLSQAKAAEIAGVSRAAFIDALHRHGVPAIQADSESLKDEMLA